MFSETFPGRFRGNAPRLAMHARIAMMILVVLIRSLPNGTLPDLKFAKRYPTVGPNGTLKTDIDGRACGIELYLGPAALTGEDGELTPVQWGGYEKKVKRYQGELADKNLVEERFLTRSNSRISLDPASPLNVKCSSLTSR
jgi:hypothetical protein